MSELTRYRDVLQCGETRVEEDGKRTVYSYQFSESSSSGCVVVSSDSKWSSGHIEFNLRTHQTASTIAERQKPLQKLELVTRAVAALLIDCGAKMNDIPCGYPEIDLMTSEVKKQGPISHNELEANQYYLCASVTPDSEPLNVLFQYTGTEQRHDGYGVPFQAILYNRRAMRRDGVDLLQYDATYQPLLTTSHGGLLEGSAAMVYDNVDSSQLRPEHFMVAHTEVAFYSASVHDAQKALDLVAPMWPHARIEGVFGE